MNDVIELDKEKLPYDIEILDNCNLFTSDEIRIIRKSRNDFDYNISNTRSARAFLEYIAYERALLFQVNEKRRAMDNGDSATKEIKKLVEQLIITKIIKLYKESLMHYQNDERIYENFFKFCKISKHLPEVLPYMVKYLEIHGDKSQVWIVAALWEYEELKNPQKARSVFTEGLSRHPTSKELYTAFIKMELLEASALSTKIENDHESKQSFAVNKIMGIYNHSKRDIFSLQFLVDLLHILENYTFTCTIQNEIVRDMSDIFPGQELTWHTLAQRELKGFHINDSFKPKSETSDKTSHIDSGTGLLIPKEDKDVVPDSYTKLTLKKRIELCAKIYYKGTQLIKTQKMWTYYINAMIDLNKDSSTQSKLRYNCLLTAFKSAHDASALTEEQYIQYIDNLKRSTDPDETEHLMLSVLHGATITYSTSVELWSMYLKYFIKQNNEAKVREIFAIATKKCDRKSLPLWELLKQYLYIITLAEDKQKQEIFFLDAMSQAEPISSHFKSEYIEWLAFTSGIREAREIFYNLIEKSPSYAMHMKMLEINKRVVVHETIERELYIHNVTESRKCFDLAMNLYGKTRPNLWLEYIKFERDFGDVKKMNVLFSIARLELDPIYLETFVSQYELLTLMQ